MSETRRTLLDSAIIFLVTCLLVAPVFKAEYITQWDSIESTFIADARMLREHLPHPAWQPLWYCGTRFDYIYPPALRYGTALISLLAGISTARAYHLYTGFLYALGIAGVYWLVYLGSRSRAQAWLAAIFTALLSPTLLLMRDFRVDSPFWVPQRLHVLAHYGEGPHISALSILGFALAASYLALREWRPGVLVAAGALCAAVVANNFYGATALAMFFPLLIWAVWLEVRRPAVWLRAIGIGMLAYGLCAFWLTPSFMRITAMNLHWVAEPSKPSSRAIGLCSAVLFCVATFLAARRKTISAWPVFVIGVAAFTSIYVLGRYYFGLAIVGGATRLNPELDLALILLAAWSLVTAWKRPLLRPFVAIVLCAACYPAGMYLAHRRVPYRRAHDVQQRPEYRLAQWMNENLPDARAMPCGSIRYWYNAWYDDAQSDGGSNQGMLNQILPMAHWQITRGDRADLAVLWLQALGVDAVIVPFSGSQEIYHEYTHPEKFQGTLPELYNDHQGNIIFRVPRRFPSIARVVDRASLAAADAPRGGVDQERLMRYVNAVENGPDSPAIAKWSGLEAIDVQAATAPGQAVLVQETYDSAWQAQADGKPLTIEHDAFGFMVIDAPPGAHTIHLHFETPLENRIGWIITGMTCFIAAIMTKWGRRFRRPTALLALVLGASALHAQPSVTTYHNDNARTGLYPNETLLAPANVKAGLFGKRFFLPADGGIYAQPLYLSRVKIPGKGFRNILFVATSHDSLYAFDADDETATGSEPLWTLNILDQTPGATTVSESDVDCPVIPELGIIGTPVIDPTSGTIYLIAVTKENGSQFVYRLHSVDVSSGRELPGSPVEIQATGFVALAQKQRAALLLSNGIIYSPWSGHCDKGTYHGFILAHDAMSLLPLGLFNDTPTDTGASFWNAGAGPAADADGSVFAVSANGDFDGNQAAARYDESVLHLSPAPGLSVTDQFTPFNRVDLDQTDKDLGSSGALLLPNDAGSPAHPQVLFVSGKEGRMYLLDRQSLGGVQVGSDSSALASLPVLNSQPTFGMAAYFDNSIYIAPVASPMYAFKVANATLASSPWAVTADSHSSPGSTPSISSNGATNGIVWLIANDDSGELLAYDASSLNELYNSNAQPADALSSNTEFTPPTIADGKVFAPGVFGVTIYGELAPIPPAISAVTNAASYAADAISTGGLISLFGSQLAPATAQADSTPLPLSIIDTSVSINGVVAPLLFVSANQINAQVPYEVPAGAATVVVRSGGRSSAPFTIQVHQAAPGVFMNAQGNAAALAEPGGIISVFFTGVGPLSVPLDDGAAPSAGQIISATLPVTATIGGQPAEVEFAGLAPLYPGTAQINVKVPAMASGVSPLVISVGGVSSNTVQLVISAN
jgi:uncharacterized protein (TIGR03437 family)